jgi:hypothetical protein
MMEHREHLAHRWSDYFLRGGSDFSPFWNIYLKKKRDILFVLGLGFDPRMCSAISDILNQGGSGKRDCLMVSYNEGLNSPSNRYTEKVQENDDKLRNLLRGRGSLKPYELDMWSPDNRRIGSIRAASIFNNVAELISYSDIIVDIGAFPLGIYFPLIGKILSILDTNGLGKAMPNLHIVVAENPMVDALINAEGIEDDAIFLHGFSNGLEVEATANIPKIWIPILGEHQEGELERINVLIKPDEICPILPFPCCSARRGDDLILKYRRLLFDKFEIEPQNIIYASENNPFEVHDKLVDTINNFNDVLSPLGGCKIALSAHSSKLLSLGALLTAYELGGNGKNVGVADVEALGYSISDTAYNASNSQNEKLYEIWLAGELYAED